MMGKTWRMKQRAGCLVQVRRLPTDTKCSEANALGIGTNCTVMHCIALHITKSTNCSATKE